MMGATWTLTAETAFSAGNVKTVDNFVPGYNNTITVTGPGDGNYSAIVTLYDPNGNALDSYPISSSANVVGPISLQEGRSMYAVGLSSLIGSIAGGVIAYVNGGANARYPNSAPSTSTDGQSIPKRKRRSQKNRAIRRPRRASLNQRHAASLQKRYARRPARNLPKQLVPRLKTQTKPRKLCCMRKSR